MYIVCRIYLLQYIQSKMVNIQIERKLITSLVPNNVMIMCANCIHIDIER